MMIRLLTLAFLLAGSLFAADYEYTLRALAPNTHTYQVEVEVAAQSGEFTLLRLAAWRPGRYYEQDFAAAISQFQVRDAAGANLRWDKVDHHTWRVWHASRPGKIRASYHVYADNMDSGSSYFDKDHYYFNPVNLFMFVPGRYDGDVRLHLPELPADWKLASSLKMAEDGKTLLASSYHELADSPTILAKDMIQISFQDQGATFYLHFHGDVIDRSPETIEAVADMLKAIAREEAAIFGGYPFDEFHFLYRFLPFQLGHGVEHEKSTVISVGASVTDTKEHFVGRLKSLTAHELFHAWNVKRLRPASMWPYDYSKPQYTTLHWFTEGVTDYYTQLVMYRAGLLTEAQFMGILAGTLANLDNNFASSVVSPSMSGYDAWLVRSEYGNPDHGISYYTQGSRLGLLLDLELRNRTENKVNLDVVFRYLWDKYFLQGAGMPEDGVQEACETLTKSSWDEFFDKYVHGTSPVDYTAILEPAGLILNSTQSETPGLRGLGILQSDVISQGILIRKIHPLGDAFVAGIGKNDLILEIDGRSVQGLNADTYVNELKRGKEIRMKVLVNYKDVQEFRVRYEGRYVPLQYTLARGKKLQPAQQQLLDSWMRSAQ